MRKLPTLTRSIRWRIGAWHGLVLLLVLTGFGVTAYRLQRANAYRHLDAELQVRLSALLGSLDRQQPPHPPPPHDASRPPPPPPPPPDGQRGGNFARGGQPMPMPPPPPGKFRLPPDLAHWFSTPDREGGNSDRDGGDFYYCLWTRTDALFGISANAPGDLRLPARGGPRAVNTRSRDGAREIFEFTPPGECLLVGASEAPLERELRRFAGALVASGLVVLALGLAGGWWLASRAIAPIRAITATATRIAAGRLDERIAEAGGAGSELDELVSVLNATFARLEAAFAEQRRFTSDAAHELRTPAAVILAQTQLALARPRPAEELRETVVVTRRAALRMQSLIESLLTLSRLDAQAAAAESSPLSRAEPCDLAALAREQLDLIRPLAEERGVLLRADELAPAVCRGDPDGLAQIFTNLLSNAVKFSRAGDEIRLHTGRENGCALVSVTDTGPGIAAEHLPHLFERFYRADASRNRAAGGGAGLGLAICKTLAETHGGTLEVQSREGHGSTFTLRLPSL